MTYANIVKYQFRGGKSVPYTPAPVDLVRPRSYLNLLQGVIIAADCAKETR